MEYTIGILSTLLISFIMLYTVYRNFKNRKKNKIKLEVPMQNFEWNPAPLIDEIQINSVKNNPRTRSLVVNSMVGKYVDINGERLLNFVSHNYLGLIENEAIKDRAKKAVYKYGVGSCGPRGFYGTVDVHLELESRLANFFKTESCIVYSYGFTTIASAIAAYAKKNDVIFVDERVNFAIQRGMEASRSEIIYFKHNDTDDLENQIKLYNAKKNKKTEPRKFLIVEGIYINTGSVCALQELIRIRREFKLRLFIDESISFGVLGRSGRGVVEHFDADIDDVDMIMASMEFALGTGGGFCVGSAFVVEHQRLAGQGYCFSASLPPFLAVAATAGIDFIEKDHSQLVKSLRERCCQLHIALQTSVILQTYFNVGGETISPVKHLLLKPSAESPRTIDEEWNILDDIIDSCQAKGVLITVAHYLANKEHFSPPPSIRLSISVTMDQSDILKLINALEDSTRSRFS